MAVKSDKNFANFFEWETADLPLTFDPPEALIDYKDIVVSLKQNDVLLHKMTNELDIDEEHGQILVSLSQEETSLFKDGRAYIQANIFYKSSKRNTTHKGILQIEDNLFKQVME